LAQNIAPTAAAEKRREALNHSLFEYFRKDREFRHFKFKGSFLYAYACTLSCVQA
jgi:hypothetical protein